MLKKCQLIFQILANGGGVIQKQKKMQINIVATLTKANYSKGTSYIVASCKWTNDKVGISELDTLKEYTRVMLGSKVQESNNKVYYYLFSKSGFKNSLISNKSKDINLVDLEMLYKK